jgi:hypothetical protein
MANNLISIFNKVLSPTTVQQQQTSTRQVQPTESSNPFNPNPFITKTVDMNTYAKNRPVQGGYFAGYYNGKPNIVGRRLFVEV